MKRFTIDQTVNEEQSRQKGVGYTVLKLEDPRIYLEIQIEELGVELLNYVDEHAQTNVCIDFDRVNFCSTAFLGKLIIVDRKLQKNGRNHLGLQNLCPEVYQTFAITRLDNLFDIDNESRNSYKTYKTYLERTSQKLF